MNKVHIAATELPVHQLQLLKQKANILGEATAQKPLSDFMQF